MVIPMTEQFSLRFLYVDNYRGIVYGEVMDIATLLLLDLLWFLIVKYFHYATLRFSLHKMMKYIVPNGMYAIVRWRVSVRNFPT